jgi:xylan 1,4-beta-xylosidase
VIRNPILKGFNPDPSICRVGDDYYIATSTFEWYPGVRIHHSTDLANWRLVARPLNRAALLDMRGNPDSCGVWAPCLSWADGRFWLVYTDVKRFDGAFKDAHNYITTCDRVDGVWSDPAYVNSSGFDPSLFHDDDGRKWFLNMRWNHRGKGTGVNPAHDAFDGILLQEWSTDKGLIGPVSMIYSGTDRGLTEAPHLFKRDGWYYLTVAEGGTGYDHAVTMARSRDIVGPYDTHPAKHVITTAHAPDSRIQRTGHGQYVEGVDGRHWHTFLMGRPLRHGNRNWSPMGRETGLAEVEWRDGWLWLKGGGQVPHESIPAGAEPVVAQPRTYLFGPGALPPVFQWLRHPYPDRLFRLGDRGLTLIGRESLGSWFEQSLVARRQEHAAYEARCILSFDPVTYQQAAGLVTYYNRNKFHALMLTHEPDVGRALTILSCPGDWPDGALTYPTPPIAVGRGPVELRVLVDGAAQQFSWRQGGDWSDIGPALNAAVISDEGGRGEHGSFTGAFVGMAAFDTSGAGREAHFASFRYAPQ